jgi:hypothetical protein
LLEQPLTSKDSTLHFWRGFEKAGSVEQAFLRAIRLRVKQHALSQPVYREDGPLDCGNGLALKSGGALCGTNRLASR